MRDLRPYSWVMLAALFINVLSLSGIVFSMQVYDRVIPAQSYPTLYVLTIGVLIATLFGFVLRVARGHIMDLLGKRSDLRVSDRVFGHALRLRNSAIPRSTGSFISQLRELEQIREMVTSSTISTIVDLPFFLLFVVVLAIIAPQLAWIAPVAAVIMVLPGLLLQKKLAALAKQSAHESTLRNAVLVESVQGLEDIKLMQAENRFLQQWNSYIQITAESGLRTRELTQNLINWGMTIQSLVYAGVIVVGAPMVIDGNLNHRFGGRRLDAGLAHDCADGHPVRRAGALAAGQSGEGRAGQHHATAHGKTSGKRRRSARTCCAAIICSSRRSSAITRKIRAWRCVLTAWRSNPARRWRSSGATARGNRRCYRRWRAAWIWRAASCVSTTSACPISTWRTCGATSAL
ncbi:Leukotoxin translocation ATP-binding protein LktB [Enterobacter cancerogenus]|uniref:Leukotoxin translocation ATP-binding protein LktB n=1 Tax=Enterobacter cancerogenus TaxID=69218 RepID=A0A484Z9S9_9ENTR|nr:Leukotoxin translocation ATP-binding protein LktB [Enterobacter cancerogenus]